MNRINEIHETQTIAENVFQNAKAQIQKTKTNVTILQRKIDAQNSKYHQLKIFKNEKIENLQIKLIVVKN